MNYDINPLKIGPFLLCYHNEGPFILGDSIYWKLHSDLKQQYNFFITNTSTDIENSKFMRNQLEGFVKKYENNVYILSNNSVPYFESDIEIILSEFKRQGKSLNHLAIFQISEIEPNSINFNYPIKIFPVYKDYNLIFKQIVEYFIDITDNLLIRLDLKEYFGISSILKVSNKIADELIRYYHQYPDKLKIIDRRLFEELVAELFFGFGYEVELTSKTRDGGRDIIAVKHAEISVKYLIECKRPDPGKKITIRPVRELYGVKTHERATKALLATTAYFTNDARIFLEQNKWELEGKDFDGIMEWIKTYNSNRFCL